MSQETDKWAIYIDIEGFSNKFEDGGRESFINLTNDLYKLGTSFFKNISIVQFGGDGFLITEILIYENNIRKAIEISTALLKAILLRGAVGRVHIAQGKLVYMGSLYCKEIKSRINNGNILEDHNNIMIINPLIGTAVINAAKLEGPKGPLLIVDCLWENEMKKANIAFERNPNYKTLQVNWLKYSTNIVDELLKSLGFYNESDYGNHLKNYITKNDELSNEWITNAEKMIANYEN